MTNRIAAFLLALTACSGATDATSVSVSEQRVAISGPSPQGLYVLNYYPTSGGYPQGLWAAPGYVSVSGHAIFVTLAQILPQAPTYDTWPDAGGWDWTFLDSLVGEATSRGKPFSLGLVVGQAGLPAGFEDGCSAGGAPCAPSFSNWLYAACRCQTYNVPLPWSPRVQQFWAAAWAAMSAHLKDTGAYASLSLVHFAGVGVWDEETRLPVDVNDPCESATTQGYYAALGFTSRSQLVPAFKVLARGLLAAFPDRTLGVSYFPPGTTGAPIDYPDWLSSKTRVIASSLEAAAETVFAGRLEIQMDCLGNGGSPGTSETVTWAATSGAQLGWQLAGNCPLGPGAGQCSDDSAASNYYGNRLASGAPATYFELWPGDVENYPVSLSIWRM